MGLKDKAGLFSVPNLKTGVLVSGGLEVEPNENTSLLSDVEEPILKDGMFSLVASSFLLAATLEVMVGVGGGSYKAFEAKVTGKEKLMPLSQVLSLLPGLVAAMGVS